MGDDLSTASLPQYSVPGPQVVGGTKYQQLLAVIEELGKDIRPTYTGNKICAERLKRSIAHSRILGVFDRSRKGSPEGCSRCCRKKPVNSKDSNIHLHIL
ncbi:hypothetical protein Q1695_013681 [Nippostrongylus brasiliensis]|nr:hypothetical protein Q1695_013681 [Nippostrongylus brasiliensis]